jgi:OOP family OmpA-OmpF porin
MKTFKITLLAALISAPLSAETIDKTWQVGVFGEYIKSQSSKEDKPDWQRVEAGRGVGIELEKIINEDWNARIELAKTRYDIDNGTDKANGARVGVDAIYKVDDSDLYFFTGVKHFNNAKSYNAINVGAGYNVQLNDRFSLYGEAAIYRDVDYGNTDQGIKLGLKYAFGDVKAAAKKSVKMPAKAVAPVVTFVDTDNDGIADVNDSCPNTIKNAKVDSRGCAIVENKVVEMNLDVRFANNSAKLQSQAMSDIQRLADFMIEHNKTSVVIEGHSSAVGKVKYNLAISQKRADAVKSELINKFDIDSSRVSAKGFGEEQLISTGNTKADHELNRRVVAKIKSTVKAVVTKD